MVMLARLRQSIWAKRRELFKFLRADISRSAEKRRRMFFEPLEPRFLLSADLPVVPQIDEVHQDASLQAEPQVIVVTDEVQLDNIIEQDDSVVESTVESSEVVAPVETIENATPVALSTEDTAFILAQQSGTQVVIIDRNVEDADSLLQQILPAEDTIIEIVIHQTSSITSTNLQAENTEDEVKDEAVSLENTGAEEDRQAIISEDENDVSTELDRIEVYFVDTERDGVEQISEILSQHSNLAAVHLLSHGSRGQLSIGNSAISTKRLQDSKQQVAAWGKALASGGDILLYGCDVADGELGLDFIQQLSRLTLADVAASTDATGGADAGGDWVLEASTGVIESSALFAQAAEYDYLLARETQTGDNNVDRFDIKTAEVIRTGTTTDTNPFVAADVLDLNGLGGKDEFKFSQLPAVSNVEIDGGASVDKIDLSAITKDLTVSLSLDKKLKVTYVDAAVNKQLLSNTINVENLVLNKLKNNTLDLSGLTDATKAITFSVIGENRISLSYDGFSLTIDNVKNLIGGAGDDVFIMQKGAVLSGTIDGMGGNNTLSFSENPDNIDGVYANNYSGNITVDLANKAVSKINNGQNNGFTGIKTFIAGDNVDTIYAAAGYEVHGARGDDVIAGSNANDTEIFGDIGDDKLIGLAGEDVLNGGSGKDTLDGGADNDTLIGGSDADTYIFEGVWGEDSVTELADGGMDTLDLTKINADVTVDLKDSTIANGGLSLTSGANKVKPSGHIETLLLGDFDKTYNFTITDNWAKGLDSQNTAVKIFTIATLNAADARVALGASSKINLDFSAVSKDLIFEIEDGLLTITDVPPEESGDHVNKLVVKAKNIVSLTGGKANNTYKIYDGGNLAGKIAAAASDQYAGKLNTLDYSEYTQTPAFKIIDIDSYATNSATGIYSGQDGGFKGMNHFVGSKADEIFTVKDAVYASVSINGGAGNDLIGGYAGDDALSGGNNNDIIIGAAGTDVLSGDAGNDVLYGGDNATQETLSGGTGKDTLYGENGVDLLLGGKGDDTLVGGAGNDVLKGGQDNDTYIFEADWGTDKVYESSKGGNDTLDFSNVTVGMTHILSGGELISTSDTVTYKTPDTTFSWAKGTVSYTTDASGNTVLVEKSTNQNEVQRLELGNATQGGFTLQLTGYAATDTITYNVDEKALAADIEAKLNAKLGTSAVKVTVSTTEDNAWDVEFQKPAFTDVTRLQFDQGTLTAGVTNASGMQVVTLKNGRTVSELQELMITAGVIGEKFKLVIGDKTTGEITFAADDTVTANSIKAELKKIPAASSNAFLNNLPDALLKYISNYDVDVDVTDTHTFRIVFNSPVNTDVGELKLSTDGINSTTVAGITKTIRDGLAASGLENIESIVASSNDNTFAFGNDWGLNHPAIFNGHEPDYLTAWYNQDQVLEIDTSKMLDTTKQNVTLLTIDEKLDPAAGFKQLEFDFAVASYDAGHDKLSLNYDLRNIIAANVDINLVLIDSTNTSTPNNAGAYRVESINWNNTTKLTELVVEQALSSDKNDVRLEYKKAISNIVVDSSDPDNDTVTFDVAQDPSAVLKDGHKITIGGVTFTIKEFSAYSAGKITLTVKGKLDANNQTTNKDAIEAASEFTRLLELDSFDRGDDAIKLSGNVSSFFLEGQEFSIDQLSGKKFKIVANATYDNTVNAPAGETTITVAQALDDNITGNTISKDYAISAVDNGNDKLTLAGDQSALFSQGGKVIAVGLETETKLFTLKEISSAADTVLTLNEGVIESTAKGKLAQAFDILSIQKDSKVLTIKGDASARFQKGDNVVTWSGSASKTYRLASNAVYDAVLDITLLTSETDISSSTDDVIYLQKDLKNITANDNSNDVLRIKGDLAAAAQKLINSNQLQIQVRDAANTTTNLTLNNLAQYKPLYVKANELTLDFRNVSQLLEFGFETDANGVTSLEVSRKASLPVVGDVLQWGDTFDVLSNIIAPEKNFAKIKFTNVDENTTIYGGGDNNSISFKPGTDYKGTFVGSTGLRNPLEVLAEAIANPQDSMNMLFPSATVINAIDYSSLIKLDTLKDTKLGDLFNYANMGDSFFAGFGSGPSYEGITGTKGLSGKVTGITDFTFGPGVNLLFGSGQGSLTSLDPRGTSAGEWFKNLATGVGGNILFGRNHFNVGSIDLKLDTDNLTGSKKFLAEAWNRTAAEQLQKYAPGIHILGGKNGADTYSFQGVWGVAAVLEVPDLIFGGAAVPEGFDTLDFQEVATDLHFTIYEVTTANKDSFRNIFSTYQNRSGDSTGNFDAIGVGTNIVIVSDQAYNINSDAAPEAPFQSGLNFVIANDIENLIGGQGKNTFTFVDGAEIQGIVTTATGGEVILDYREFRNPSDSVGVTANMDVASVNIIPSYNVFGYDTTAVDFDYGSADGIIGSRLAGFDTLINEWFGASLPTGNWGVNNITKIIGSSGNDHLTGNDLKDNTFVLTSGGVDWVDGKGTTASGDGDTVSYEEATIEVTLNLDTDSGSFDGNTLTLLNIENLEGGKGNDRLTGDSNENIYYFKDDWGIDVITTNGGEDFLDFSAVAEQVTRAADRIAASTMVNGVDVQGAVLYTTTSGNTVYVLGGYNESDTDDESNLDPAATNHAWISYISPLLSGYINPLKIAIQDGSFGGDFSNLNEAEVEQLASAALQRWLDVAGVENLPALNNIVIQITELADGLLGLATDNTIYIDNNAAGAGWFVDSTPTDDSEYTLQADGSLTANAGTTAVDAVDLLTTLMHEMGHLLGLDHVAQDSALLDSTLEVGTRSNPTAADRELVAQGLAPLSGLAAILQNSEKTAISNGLTDFSSWAVDFETQLDDIFGPELPFTGQTLADLFGLTDLDIQSKLDSFKTSFAALFIDSSTDVTEQALSSAGLDVSIVSDTDRKQFQARIDLIDPLNQNINIDVSSLSLPSDFLGLDLDLGSFGLSGDFPTFSLSGGITMTLDFGVDENGDFFVANPGIRGDIRFGESALQVVDVNTAGHGITLAGDQTALFNIGEQLEIASSDGNDGYYVIDSIAIDAGTTTIMFSTAFENASPISNGQAINADGAAVDIDSYIENKDSFTFAGELPQDYQNGTRDVIFVSDSSGNDGAYTIDRIELDASGNSIVYVNETILHDVVAGHMRTTFDASVNLGPLTLGLEDAVLGFDAGIFVGTEAALNAGDLTSTTLADFMIQKGIRPDSSYDVLLPLALTTPLSGLEIEPVVLTASSSLGLPSASNLAQFLGNMAYLFPSTLDINNLISFNGFSLDDLLNVIEYALDELVGDKVDDPDTTSDEQGLIYKDMPLISKSAADILGGNGTDFITQIRDIFKEARAAVNDLSGFESTVNNELRNLLGLSTTDKPFALSYEDSSFNLDLELGASYNETVDLSVDLGSYLDEYASLPLDIDIDSTAKIDVAAFADLDIGFSFDLSDVTNPTLFFDDDTGLSFGLDVESNGPLGFKTAIDVPVIGPVGLYVDNGSGHVSLNGRAGLADDSDDDNRWTLSELGDAFEFEFDGSAELDLPFYFPTASMPLGGFDTDINGDGIAENALHFSADIDKTGLSNKIINVPSLVPSFDLFAMLNDPKLVLTGLEGMFDNLKNKVAERFESIGLPMIGDKLQSAADFIDEKLRPALLGIQDINIAHISSNTDTTTADSLRGRYDTVGLGSFLLDAYVNGDSTVESLLDKIRTTLYEAYGEPGLDILVIQQTDIDGNLVFDANGNPAVTNVSSADQIELSIAGSEFKFNVLLADNIFDEAIQLNFDASAPGLSLKADDAALQFKLDYTFCLGFGFNSDIGLFMDTSGATEDGEEFSLTAEATILSDPNDPASLEAKLGFLRAIVTERHDDDGASGLYGKISLDLKDDGDDGKWDIGNESLEVIANLNVNANADFDVKVDIPAGSNLSFPEINAIFHYDQTFADLTISSTSGSTLEIGGSPDIVFENVTLDLGKAISGFVGPIANKVGDILAPIKPLIDLLNLEVDLGITKLRMLDLARLKLTATQFSKVEKAVDAVSDVIDLIDAVNKVSGDSVMINFGDFYVGGDMATADTPDKKANTEVAAGAGKTPDLNNDPNISSSNKQVTKQFGTTKGSFEFPLLQNPSAVFGLLMGKDVDLFLYNLPALDLNFEYIQSYMVYPGLNARIGGNITAKTNFAFGFDTSGFNDWSTNYNFSAGDIDVIFNGFFVRDKDLLTGEEIVEATITAGLKAGASVGIGGLVEAGVDGGIEAKIEFDLNDFGSLSAPSGDGKLRVDEILKRLEHGPQCLFDMHGALSAFLEAFFWVGVKVFGAEITIFEARDRFIEAVLAEFNYSCPPPASPDISYLDSASKTLTLRYNDNANVLTNDEDLGRHNYTVERLDVLNESALKKLAAAVDYELNKDDITDGKLVKDNNNRVLSTITGPVLVVRGRGMVEVYREDEVDLIRAYGTNKTLSDDNLDFDEEASDTYTIKEGVNANIELHGAGGADRIEVRGGGSDIKVYGDGGKDKLTVYGNLDSANIFMAGGDYADELMIKLDEGQVASYTQSRLEGGKGNDTLIGNAGVDFIYGGDDNDYLYGDAGNDELHGGSGDDTLIGDDTQNAITGKDKLYGDAGDDRLIGGAGDDELFGGFNPNDISFDPLADDGKDILVGGLGDDTIDGGTNADFISWQVGHGSDTIFGGSSLYSDPDTGDDKSHRDRLEILGAAGTTEDSVSINTGSIDRSGNYRAIVLDYSAKGKTETLNLQELEELSIDTGEGGDDITVSDLRAAELRNLELELGTGEKLYDYAIRENRVDDAATIDANNPVFADFDKVFAAQQKVFLQTDPLASDEVVLQEFHRYELSKGKFLFNSDGSPLLDAVIINDQKYLVQAFDGEKLNDTLVAYEIRAKDLGAGQLLVTQESAGLPDGQNTDQSFYRYQLDEGYYLFDANGHPVLDSINLGGVIYQIQRNNVDAVRKTDINAKLILEAVETRTEQMSRRIEKSILVQTDPNDPNSDWVDSGEKAYFADPEYGLDSQEDKVTIYGGDDKDQFLFASERETNGNETVSLSHLIGNNDSLNFSIKEGNLADDQLHLITGAGEDEVFAENLQHDVFAELRIETGDDNDLIVGSKFGEVIDSGLDDDTVTGNGGVDTFIDAGGEDLLIEERDANFILSDNSFTVEVLGVGRVTGTDERGFALVERDVLVTETENLNGIFEKVRLTAVDPERTFDHDNKADTPLRADPAQAQLYINKFTVTDWTGNADLMGGEGGDEYDVTLSGDSATATESMVNILDTGDYELDSIVINGTTGNDLIHFDNQYVERLLLDDANSVFLALNEFTTDINVRNVEDLPIKLRQKVIYNGVEDAEVRGRAGHDIFIADDSNSELDVYGDSGADSFYIGNVLSTRIVNDPDYGAIEVVDQVTRGVSFTSSFHGGTGDDYFEINHNQSEIFLYGDEDDDTFVIKALLTTEGNDINITNNGGGSDVLAYVKNAPLNIFGGTGFDTVAIIGTEASDTFYIFVEEEGGVPVQRVYGAGLVIPTIDSIERLLLITGGGDDTIYLYGTLDDQEIAIDTGKGNDTIYVGGDPVDFSATIPQSNSFVYQEIPQPDKVVTKNILVSPAHYEKRVSSYSIFGVTIWSYTWYQYIPPVYELRTTYIPQPPIVSPVRTVVPEYKLPVHLPETRQLNDIKGPVTINGGDDDDRIIVDNSFGDSNSTQGSLLEQTIETIAVEDNVQVLDLETDSTKLTVSLNKPVDMQKIDLAVQQLLAHSMQSGSADYSRIRALSGVDTYTVTMPVGMLLKVLSPAEYVTQQTSNTYGSNYEVVKFIETIDGIDYERAYVFSNQQITVTVAADYILNDALVVKTLDTLELDDVVINRDYTIYGIDVSFADPTLLTRAIDTKIKRLHKMRDAGLAERLVNGETYSLTLHEGVLVQVYEFGEVGQAHLDALKAQGYLIKTDIDTQESRVYTGRDITVDLDADYLDSYSTIRSKDYDTVTGLGSAFGIYYEGTENLDIHLSNHDDQFVVYDTGAITEIYGNGGDDDIRVLSTDAVHPLTIHGDTADNYTEDFRRHTTELGQLLGLGSDFDIKNLAHVQALLAELSNRYTDIDINSNGVKFISNFNMEEYDQAIMAMIRGNVNELGDFTGSYAEKPARLGELLNLGRDYDKYSRSDMNLLAQYLNNQYADVNIDYNNAALDDDDLNILLEEYKDLTWAKMKERFNIIKPGEHYSDHLNRLRIDKGKLIILKDVNVYPASSRAYNSDLVEDQRALVAQLVEDFNFKLQPKHVFETPVEVETITETRTIQFQYPVFNYSLSPFTFSPFSYTWKTFTYTYNISYQKTNPLYLDDYRDEIWQMLTSANLVSKPVGDDTITLGSIFDDSGNLEGIQGRVEVYGQGGSDHINLRDVGDTVDQIINLTTEDVTGLAHADGLGMRFGVFFETDLNDRMTIELGAGDDVANVRANYVPTRIVGNLGDERFYVSSAANYVLDTDTDYLAGNLDKIFGDLSIDAGTGRHKIMVSDEASDNANTNVQLTNALISGLAQGTIHYQADAAGNFAEGIWLWTGQGSDAINVTSTHQRDGVRTSTVLNTQRGDDRVNVNLQADSDGFFVLNTEEGNDIIDATGSTLDILIFGGLGLDDITAGDGNDIIFGDRGRVDYVDENDIVVARFGTGGPGDFTDGVVRDPANIYMADPLAGDDDVIDTGNGNNIAIGGAGDDRITGGDGVDFLFGDTGSVTVGENKTVYETTVDNVSGDDYIDGGDNNDYLFGGEGRDSFVGDFGEDVIIGEHGRVTISAVKNSFELGLGQGEVDAVSAALLGLYNAVPLTAQNNSSVGGLLPGGTTATVFQPTSTNGIGLSVTHHGRALNSQPTAPDSTPGEQELAQIIQANPPAAGLETPAKNAQSLDDVVCTTKEGRSVTVGELWSKLWEVDSVGTFFSNLGDIFSTVVGEEIKLPNKEICVPVKNDGTSSDAGSNTDTLNAVVGGMVGWQVLGRASSKSTSTRMDISALAGLRHTNKERRFIRWQD